MRVLDVQNEMWFMYIITDRYSGPHTGCRGTIDLVWSQIVGGLSEQFGQ